MKCSICGNDIGIQLGGWDQGNNAQPINSGRCCSHCNDTVVIPQRVRDAMAALTTRRARGNKGGA